MVSTFSWTPAITESSITVPLNSRFAIESSRSRICSKNGSTLFLVASEMLLSSTSIPSTILEVSLYQFPKSMATFCPTILNAAPTTNPIAAPAGPPITNPIPAPASPEEKAAWSIVKILSSVPLLICPLIWAEILFRFNCSAVARENPINAPCGVFVTRKPMAPPRPAIRDVPMLAFTPL